MKTYGKFALMGLLALAFLFASCSKSELEPPVNSNSNNITSDGYDPIAGLYEVEPGNESPGDPGIVDFQYGAAGPVEGLSGAEAEGAETNLANLRELNLNGCLKKLPNETCI